MDREMRRVETYPDYPQARRAMERLIERGLPASSMSVSARGIRLVERMQPRSWLQAAGEGALNGAAIGLPVGVLLGLFNLTAPAVSALVLGFWGAVIGLFAGLLVSLLVHAVRSDEARHTTQRSIEADHFDLVVDEDRAEEARHTLSSTDRAATAKVA